MDKDTDVSAKKRKRKKRSACIEEEAIVSGVAEIAFGENTKDSDRLRALDWLEEHRRRSRGHADVLEKLDRVLAEIKSSF